jgi:hypothetical protein
MSASAMDIFASPETFEEYCARIAGRIRSRGEERADFLKRSLERLDSLIQMARAVHDVELETELSEQIAAIREEMSELEPGSSPSSAVQTAEPAVLERVTESAASASGPGPGGMPLWNPFGASQGLDTNPLLDDAPAVSANGGPAVAAEPASVFTLEEPARTVQPTPELSRTPYEVGDAVGLSAFEALAEDAPVPEPADSMAAGGAFVPSPPLAAPTSHQDGSSQELWGASRMTAPAASEAVSAPADTTPVMGTAVPMATPPTKDWDLDFRGGPAAGFAPAFEFPGQTPALSPTASASGTPTPALQLEINVGEQTFASTVVGAVLVGRRDPERRATPDIDLWPDDAVSRRHAEIILRSGRYYLLDLGSTNGTVLNGRALPPKVETELRLGDEITLGERTSIRILHASH